MIAEYSMRVKCQDQATPPMMAVENLQVTVADENDNAPEFPHKEYHVSLLEGSPIGTRIAQV